MQDLFDCIIVGGGPAGLNAAILLGRCHRKVVVFDSEQYRNYYAHGMHNYLTRDDIPPAEFLKLCHAELDKYQVPRILKKVLQGRLNSEGIFEVRTEDNKVYYSKKMLIATGLQDNWPEVPGMQQFYGGSIHHCPYCDGWEVSNKKLGVYARNKEGWELALNLKGWSDDVTLYTDGKNKVKPAQKEQLDAIGVNVVTKKWARVEGEGVQLKTIIFSDGSTAPCDALFFVNGFTQRCNIATTFECEVSRKGVIVTNRFQQTSTPGLYVAGDADKDMHFVVVAAAEGAKAGVMINKELQKEWASEQLRKQRSRAVVNAV